MRVFIKEIETKSLIINFTKRVLKKIKMIF